MGNDEPLQENNLSEEIQRESFVVTPELVTKWKEFYLREGHTFHSTTTYYNYLKRFVGYGIKINQKTVDKFREKNMAGACSGAMKNFFKFLVLKHKFPQEILDLHFEKSKSTKKFPKSITPLEVQKVIDSMPDLKTRNLTLVIYTLGLRVSEALKLKWSDFEWITWLLDVSKQGQVNLKNTKGGKFRAIPVPADLMSKLYYDHPKRTTQGVPLGNTKFDLVFDFGMGNYESGNESIDEKQYNYVVVHAEDRYRKLLYKVSQEVLGKRINPHQLRHAKALDLMNHNVPLETIKGFLGHANISSTEIYASASSEKIRADLEKYYKKDE